LKLNLGSGKTYLPDFLNVDIAENFANDKVVKPDLLYDMTKLEFPPETFTEVKAHDCLDHIEYIECLALVRRIYGWLKPNGILDVHLPNLRTLAAILAVQENHHAELWLIGTDGCENYYPTNKIRWSYSKMAFFKILQNAGFTIISAAETCNNFGFRVIVVKR
jgi:predicted SAM-dependent methyltransferase